MITIDVVSRSKQWQHSTAKSIATILKKIIKHSDLSGFANKANNILQINVALLSDRQIQQINQQFRQKNKPTNVLSFANIDENEIRANGIQSILANNSFVVLGDIVLAQQTIAKEAKEQNKTFDHHLSHLLVHAFLHLLGYDHEQQHMATEMESLEIAILAKLNIKNPYQL